MDWFDGASVECTNDLTIQEAIRLHLEGFATADDLQAEADRNIVEV